MINQLISIPDAVMVRQAFIEIEKLNEETMDYGLKLSEENIKLILSTRKEALISSGRVEFGGGIITKIISAFCDSPYIFQYNYVETINDLIETFYYYKNETMEEISDDELIDFMKDYFDDKCQGDLELLKYKYLEKAAHNVKYGVKDFLNVDDNLEEDEVEDDE